MTPAKPTNWATERMDRIRKERLRDEALPAPPLTGDLIAWLITAFPPRCYNPHDESLEDHLRYSGQVDLVDSLVSEWRQQQEDQVSSTMPVPDADYGHGEDRDSAYAEATLYMKE